MEKGAQTLPIRPYPAIVIHHKTCPRKPRRRLPGFREDVSLSIVKLPVVNQPLSFLIKGKAHQATCIDIFDGGYGYYFDAVFPKTTRYKFSAGEQCGLPEFGPKCLADFVSYPKRDAWTVRFLLPKWS